MIIFLYGQDTYRSRRKLEEIVARYKEVHKSGLNLRFFDGENLDYRDFKDIFQQISMFQEKKLIILKDIFQNQEFKTAFLKDGKKFIDSKDIIIFQEEGKIASKDALLKFLIENSKAQAFELLEGQKLKNWADREFKKYGAEIDPQALEVMIGNTGNDLWRASNEVQKLAAFKKGKNITVQDVSLLVRPQIETDIFKTIDALAARNKKQAVSLIHEHLEKGDSPLYLLSMINFQFRNLLAAKETGKLNSHPYFARKILGLAQRFTFEDLRRIYRKIFEADLKIKTGQLDPQIALDLLITAI
ncbi:MAG: DNA polymerase III subunit delta [Candidatus Nealsonbacteria bacterium]|nr:DNA polymerase III subunit delta [Candidatus Nealsonbacteria bacterium]